MTNQHTVKKRTVVPQQHYGLSVYMTSLTSRHCQGNRVSFVDVERQ